MGALQRRSRQRSPSFLGKLLSLPFIWWHPRICVVSGLITWGRFELPVCQRPALTLDQVCGLEGWSTPSGKGQRMKG